MNDAPRSGGREEIKDGGNIDYFFFLLTNKKYFRKTAPNQNRQVRKSTLYSLIEGTRCGRSYLQPDILKKVITSFYLIFSSFFARFEVKNLSRSSI